jgi:hypothetical protein
MAKKLDKNEAGFLAALVKDDPDGENWSASWRIGGLADPTQEAATAFAVAKHLYSRKLLDKSSGRATEINNGYAINDAGKEALSAWRSEQGLDEKEETG